MWGDLPTGFVIDAERRRLENEGTAVMVRHRGEPDRGTVLAVINHLDGTCSVWGQSRNLQGELGWYQPKGAAPLTEADAEALILRSVQRDPDVWVLEIESRAFRLPFTS